MIHDHQCLNGQDFSHLTVKIETVLTKDTIYIFANLIDTAINHKTIKAIVWIVLYLSEWNKNMLLAATAGRG